MTLARAEIREAVPDDAPAILTYLAAVGGETPYLTFGSDGPGITEDEERRFIERIRGEPSTGLILLALVDGELAGCLTFETGKRSRLRHAGEFGISVAQRFHGLGIGRRLIEMLIEWALGTGVVRKINLLARADNARAIALYTRLGFVMEGCRRRDSLVDGTFYDAVLMGMDIDPLDH